MPTYTLKNIKTGEIKDRFISISKMEELTSSGEYTQIIGAVNTVSGVGNQLRNTPEGFKDVLREVKRKSPMSTMEIN